MAHFRDDLKASTLPDAKRDCVAANIKALLVCIPLQSFVDLLREALNESLVQQRNDMILYLSTAKSRTGSGW